MVRKLVLALVGSAALAIVAAGAALADGNPSPTGTGQPSQSCQSQPNTPGNSATAPGSAFNTLGKAGTVYAGTQPQNSTNSHSVAQYDVACYQVSH
jgi:hypothetical protein